MSPPKSFALHHGTPTISFNPYCEASAHPWEGGTSSQAPAEVVSSDYFNKRIGLGVGLSAFLLAVIASLAYAGYRRTQRHRQIQQLGAQRILERRGTASAVVDTRRPVHDREMLNAASETAHYTEVRPK